MTFIEVPPDPDPAPFQGLVPLDMGLIATVPVPRISGGGAAAAAGTSGGIPYPALGTDTFRREMVIPGTGEITDPETCGSWFTSAACSQDPDHFIRHIEQHCNELNCPVCFGQVTAKQGARISERLRGYIEAAGRGQRTLDLSDNVLWHQDNSRYLNHYVLSAPKTVITQDMDIDQIKEAGKAMAARVGITGGVMVFHPYRIRKDVQTRLSYACREAVRMNEDEREKKFWELVRQDALGLGTWFDYVEWGPHYHIIGFGRLPINPYPKGSDQAKEWAETSFAGWLPRWIRHVSTEIKYNREAAAIRDPIAELSAYILSHTAYIKGKKAPAWIGCCTPGRLKKIGKPDKQSFQVFCPKCGSPVILGGKDNAGNFVPKYDAEGSLINYRLRYHIQGYQILTKTGRSSRRISARAQAVWGPAGPPGAQT